MCGIIGACAHNKNVTETLLDGIKRLEYRGYDSAGIAIMSSRTAVIDCLRTVGKVSQLERTLRQHPLHGHAGIAHTRWATHGAPSETNAHPHCSSQEVAIVHNGIIENHENLRQELLQLGYLFQSETDSEVIAHLLHYFLQDEKNPLAAIRKMTQRLEGAYGLAILLSHYPQKLFAARRASPLIIGQGQQQNLIASDQVALLPVSQHLIYLDNDAVACITCDEVVIENAQGQRIEPVPHRCHEKEAETAEKGNYRHFMLKEIFEQPRAIHNTIETSLANNRLVSPFGHQAEQLFKTIKRVRMVACGTSYHASLVAHHWIERLTGLPCQVEIASENRYRQAIVEPNTLFVALSQSGETADTLAALCQAKEQGHAATLAICNAPDSSLVRETDLSFITHAGIEIGVAATKTFTAQLVALLLLVIALGRHHHLPREKERTMIKNLQELPLIAEEILKLEPLIQQLAKRFENKQHALFLGRGEHHPIALEGALKLKEISYIHAEAYPAGELKHGALALVDEHMPVIVVAPHNHLSEKLASNIQEVQARGGELFIFGAPELEWTDQDNTHVITMPSTPEILTPIAYTIPLQLLSYYIAKLKGTDIDQPRNLAKSVTVE